MKEMCPNFPTLLQIYFCSTELTLLADLCFTCIFSFSSPPFINSPFSPLPLFISFSLLISFVSPFSLLPYPPPSLELKYLCYCFFRPTGSSLLELCKKYMDTIAGGKTVEIVQNKICNVNFCPLNGENGFYNYKSRLALAN